MKLESLQLYIDAIAKIDRILRDPVETLADAVRRYVRGEISHIPPYISAAAMPPSGSYRITAALCCSTFQRLWMRRRRIAWLDGHSEEWSDFIAAFPEKIVPPLTPYADTPDDFKAYIDALESKSFGALNPLTASQLFWVMINDGERLAHGGIGFLAFFSMAWALSRRYPNPTAQGAALEPWIPTAYVTSKCLFPIHRLVNICRRRGVLFGTIADTVKKLDALSTREDETGRWQFTFGLDGLSNAIEAASTFAVNRGEFIKHAAAISLQASGLHRTTMNETWTKLRSELGVLLRDFHATNQKVLETAAPVVETLQPKIIQMLGGENRDVLLERCTQFRQRGDETYWNDHVRAATQANELCSTVLEMLKATTVPCEKLTKSPSAEDLSSALLTLKKSNEAVAGEIERSVAPAAAWCQSVVLQEIAHASAGNDTDFDPAELVSAISTMVRYGRIRTPEARDAIGKALIGARSDGSWSVGQPYFIRDRLLGAWTTTSDIVWTLASAVSSHPQVDIADDAFLRYVDWLERTRTEAFWPSRERIVGWSSERLRQTATVDIWATCGAINALIPIRSLMEFRILDACEKRFTVIENPRTFADVDPVDLDQPHGHRLHRRLLEMGRNMTGPDYRNATYSIVLHGPPGSSKSSIAEALASVMSQSARVPRRARSERGVRTRMFRITPADFTRSGENGIEAEATAIFSALSHIRGAVIFFDEIDDLLRRRDAEQDVTFIRLVVPAMLNRLQDLRDACPRQEICFVIGTNFIENIDPALIRPGRIDRTIPVPYPDRRSRLMVAEKTNVPSELVTEILNVTSGWPWAAVRELCRETAKQPTVFERIAGALGRRAQRSFEFYHQKQRWAKRSLQLQHELVATLPGTEQEDERVITDLVDALRMANLDNRRQSDLEREIRDEARSAREDRLPALGTKNQTSRKGRRQRNRL
jgi:hypothetical protein